MKLYIDIETTGLSPNENEITVIGALKGKEFVQLINGVNLENSAVNELFNGVTEVISFNGKRFDLPFIQTQFNEITVNCNHKDLMILGWNKGFYGGLKKLEQMFGLTRESGVSNGFEAVILWKKHCKGCKESLEKLLEYNKEDVMNLVKLEKILERKGKN
ncbi:MAG: ribonuclease H-like domain-containing protein [Candidatus Diapherotrites archaeon]|nr:ribonuclease H-like domain-containing protein [Candidatus Diapherotrites archaeon]